MQSEFHTHYMQRSFRCEGLWESHDATISVIFHVDNWLQIYECFLGAWTSVTLMSKRILTHRLKNASVFKSIVLK